MDGWVAVNKGKKHSIGCDWVSELGVGVWHLVLNSLDQGVGDFAEKSVCRQIDRIMD